MAGMNYRQTQTFDPRAYATPEDWLAMLQTLDQRADYAPQPGAAGPATVDASSGGLLSRLAALHAAQQSPVSNNEARGSIPVEPADPNFRQLSRVPPSRSEVVSGPSSRTDGRPRSYNPSAEDIGQPNPRLVPLQGESFGDGTENGGTPPGNTIPVGWRGLPLPIPMPIPPSGPVTVPQIPMPHIPEAWRQMWRLLQILPRVASGAFRGGGDDYSRCIRAADGDTDDWEELCRRLEYGQNNTAGGESVGRACWSKTYESRQNKKAWCDNQFRDQ